jgi:hypothetical protein
VIKIKILLELPLGRKVSQGVYESKEKGLVKKNLYFPPI